MHLDSMNFRLKLEMQHTTWVALCYGISYVTRHPVVAYKKLLKCPCVSLAGVRMRPVCRSAKVRGLDITRSRRWASLILRRASCNMARLAAFLTRLGLRWIPVRRRVPEILFVHFSSLSRALFKFSWFLFLLRVKLKLAMICCSLSTFRWYLYHFDIHLLGTLSITFYLEIKYKIS